MTLYVIWVILLHFCPFRFGFVYSIEIDMSLFLHAIRDQISLEFNNEQKSFGMNHHGVLRDLYNDVYAKYTFNYPIMIMHESLGMGQFGNNFGGFLTNLACAHISGFHVVIFDIKRHWYEGIERPGQHFFESLPSVIVHDNPAVNKTVAINNYKAYCNALTSFPWAVSSDGHYFPKLNEMIIYWRPIVQEALYKESKKRLLFGTFVNTTLFIPDHLREYTKGEKSSGMVDKPDLYENEKLRNRKNLPMYPDVTIQYRCSDNVFFDNMGLLPYRYILNTIPTDAEFIFVTTEGSERNKHICEPIIQVLVDKIQTMLPQSHVVIRSGGRNHDVMFEIIDMFVNSRVVVSSSSTCGAYFSLSNSVGQVYYPEMKFMGHNNLTCYGSQVSCGNVHTIECGYSISFWIKPDGTAITESSATSQDMIDILNNETYYCAHKRCTQRCLSHQS